jgi:16S rRNA U1498 N3-methylase RsmE
VAKRLPPIVDRLSGVLDEDDQTRTVLGWLLEGDSSWNLGADVLLLAHPGQAATSVADALDDVEPNQRVLLAVGPEGGWTDYELELLEKAGFRKVGLGSRTFTTDVACISLVSAVRERLQSWR